MELGSLSLSLSALCATAAGVGFLHTLFGPDHYVPFVAMSRVGRWSLTKTAVITLLCGLGHVLSSVVLGVVGIAAGIALFKLETVEGLRGDLAGWLMLAFGLTYFVWGVHNAIRNKPHTHIHAHADGTAHRHTHTHTVDHSHVHGQATVSDAGHPEQERGAGAMTPWVLFTIFVFGPCEPLIPMLMYPAAEGNAWGVALVTLVFGMATLATMTTLVLLACIGVTKFTLGRYQRYGHAAAGLLLLACGAAVVLGL